MLIVDGREGTSWRAEITAGADWVSFNRTAPGGQTVKTIQRRGLRVAGVGSGVGLRETEGADLHALGQRDQIFLLLLLGAVGENNPVVIAFSFFFPS